MTPRFALAQGGQSDAAGPETGFPSTALGISGPAVVTTVTGLTVEGNTWFDKLSVADFGIYIDDAGRRFVPLLRLLSLLNATGGIRQGVVTFSVSRGATASIDIARQRLSVGDRVIPLRVHSGISDLTRRAELFVPEDVIKQAFAIDYRWSDADYAYTLKAVRPLRVFEAMERDRRHESAAVQPVSSNLSETEGLQQPDGSRQLISMVDASLRADMRGTGNATNDMFGIVRPDVIAYGQIGRGDYYLNFENNITYPGAGVPTADTWIKQGLWAYETTDKSVRVGDDVIGMSGLIFPSTRVTGVVIRGMTGLDPATDDGRQFLAGNGFSFLNQGHFGGYAALGSTVEIYVNNRLVDTTVVDNTPGAPPGQGAYQFVVSGLLNQSVNEVRVVIVRPDGTRQQDVKEVVGSSALLPAGRSAYAFAAGTRRNVSNYTSEAYGGLAAGGYYYGLTPNATVGVLVAAQNDFAPAFDLTGGARLGGRTYVGQTLSYRIFDHLLFKGEEAVNYISASGDITQATDLSLNYITRPMLLSTSVFDYGQDYSNGTIPIANRRGYSLFGGSHVGGWDLGASWAHIEQLSGNAAEDYGAAQAVVSFPRRRTQTFWRIDHDRRRNDPLSLAATENLTMYSVGLKTGPWGADRLEMNYSQGDRIDYASPGDLRYGLDIPLAGSVPTYGAAITAEHAINPFSRISITYHDYFQDLRYAEVDFSRAPRVTGDFDMAVRYKRDLVRDSNSAEANLEYPLDSRRALLVGMNLIYSGLVQNTVYDFYVSMRDLFYYDHGRFGRIDGARSLNPQMGGLKGRVYLDVNANGHYDDGEPGLAGVQVILDGRTHYTSDAAGYFFVARNINEDQPVVELDETSLPATYTPIQGRQRAHWQDDVFTRVYLGVAVLGSASGRAFYRLSDGIARPMAGVVIKARRLTDGAIVKQSITDEGGIYYLGELKPGRYRLEADDNSVPPFLGLYGAPPVVTLRAAETPIDLQDVDILFTEKKR